MLDGTAMLENNFLVSSIIKYATTLWLSDCILGHLSQRNENTVTQKACIWIFIAALFIITKTWKQPGYPLVNEWLKKLWDVLPMEYYLTIKSNKLLILEKTWMNLQRIMPSKISQFQNVIYGMILFLITFSKWQNSRHREQISSCQGLKRCRLWKKWVWL